MDHPLLFILVWLLCGLFTTMTPKPHSFSYKQTIAEMALRDANNLLGERAFRIIILVCFVLIVILWPIDLAYVIFLWIKELLCED
jgi:hypothetical protein